jgi:hypothetical protein
LLRRVLKLAITVAVLVVALPYAWGPLYRFPEARPFTGSSLLNPYAGMGGVWQRANLHAHGRAWIGLTNGRQPDEEVARRYRDLGYAIAGVSDYQRIVTLPGGPDIPLYEHGYNIEKRHQLAIGARAVEWFDFLLWQSVSDEQFVIDRVKRKAELVALTHPRTRDAYSPDDLQQLTGYDLLEIVNGPFAADDEWDAALSAGRAVWGLANDDTHDVTDPRRTAAAWNMINAPSTSLTDTVAALKGGRSYAVLRTGAVDAAHVTTLAGFEVQGSTITVTCAGAPSTFTFIGQNAGVRRTVKDAMSATYSFGDGDTYIRTVIESPQTVLYLNPVFRFEGEHHIAPIATVDAVGTWMFRGSFLLVCGLIVLAFTRRRAVPGDAVRPVLADAKRKTA